MYVVFVCLGLGDNRKVISCFRDIYEIFCAWEPVVWDPVA